MIKVSSVILLWITGAILQGCAAAPEPRTGEATGTPGITSGPREEKVEDAGRIPPEGLATGQSDLLLRLDNLEKTATQQVKPVTIGNRFVDNGNELLEEIRRGLANGLPREELERKLSEAEWFRKAYDLNARMTEEQGSKHASLDEVIRLYSRVIEMDPRCAEAYVNRGVAYRWTGQLELAIKDYNEAIALNPNYALAFFNRGNLYGLKLDTAQAIQDYSKAIELDPSFAAAYHVRAIAYGLKGDYQRAAKDYQRACELGDKKACDWLQGRTSSGP